MNSAALKLFVLYHSVICGALNHNAHSKCEDKLRKKNFSICLVSIHLKDPGPERDICVNWDLFKPSSCNRTSAMATAQKRITKVGSVKRKGELDRANDLPQEYADIQRKPLDGMRISLPSEADIHQWQILIDGPKGSPYEVCRLPAQLPTHCRSF